jgi:hypothetical protein
VEYDDSTCLSLKEILILTNDYDKVNSFLVEKNVLISPNYILHNRCTMLYLGM